MTQTKSESVMRNRSWFFVPCYLFVLAATCLLPACASVPNNPGFARNSDSYCQDLAATAQRAAMARDRGEKYSSTYAINGYRPTSDYPTDFDAAHDRKLVAEAAFHSAADPESIRKAVLSTCLPKD